MTTETKTRDNVRERQLYAVRSFFQHEPNRWHSVQKVYGYLSFYFDFEDGHPTRPRTRALIRECVEQGQPIVSGSKGFRWTLTESEIRAAADKLASRALRILERREKLLKAGGLA